MAFGGIRTNSRRGRLFLRRGEALALGFPPKRYGGGFFSTTLRGTATTSTFTRKAILGRSCGRTARSPVPSRRSRYLVVFGKWPDTPHNTIGYARYLKSQVRYVVRSSEVEHARQHGARHGSCFLLDLWWPDTEPPETGLCSSFTGAILAPYRAPIHSVSTKRAGLSGPRSKSWALWHQGQSEEYSATKMYVVSPRTPPTPTQRSHPPSPIPLLLHATSPAGQPPQPLALGPVIRTDGSAIVEGHQREGGTAAVRTVPSAPFDGAYTSGRRALSEGDQSAPAAFHLSNQ